MLNTRRQTTSRPGERGITMIIGAVMMLGLFAFAGLAVDIGYLQMTRLRAQAAADAAAEGALFEMKDGNSDTTAAGQHDAALNGFTDGVNGTTVVINTPPTHGSLSGNSRAVEAIVTRSVPTFFMRVVNFGAVNVTGYASGALPAASLGCIYALDPTASRALQVDGSTATFNCGAVVESNSSTAFHMEGANTTYMGTNATLSVVGPSSCTAHSPALPNSCGFDLTGQTQVCPETGSCNSSTYPTSSGITSPGDPLSSIAAPSASGVTIRSSNSTTWTNNNPPTNNQFQPGVYCGGITMNSNGLTWTMQPGTYIMAGGGFTVQNGTVLNGTGVTIYNTSAASAGVSCSGGGTFQPVTMSGQVNVTLSAPTTGSLAGILFFQDRSLGTTSTLNQINGGSNTVLNGALYFKNSELLYSGNTSASGYTVLVADTININGNSSTTVNMVNSPLSSGGTVRAIPAISQ